MFLTCALSILAALVLVLLREAITILRARAPRQAAVLRLGPAPAMASAAQWQATRSAARSSR